MRTSMKVFISIVILICLISCVQRTTKAQSPVQCGSIVKGEYTDGIEYSLTLNAGEIIDVVGIPTGDYFQFEILLDNQVGEVAVSTITLSAKGPHLRSGILSVTGQYVIKILSNQSAGGYTLYIGCTLQNGSVIKPGNIPTPTAQPKPTSTIIPSTAVPGSGSVSTFSGNGFPGLAPVDFSDAVTVSLQDGLNNGKLPVNGNTVLGYTVDAKADNTLDLSFTRVSGNLNLGLVVLSPDNKVIYQASLVNTKTMAASFSLPTTGQYIIGVFRIDLLPPSSPQATSFQIQGKLNP